MLIGLAIEGGPVDNQGHLYEWGVRRRSRSNSHGNETKWTLRAAVSRIHHSERSVSVRKEIKRSRRQEKNGVFPELSEQGAVYGRLQTLARIGGKGKGNAVLVPRHGKR